MFDKNIAYHVDFLEKVSLLRADLKTEIKNVVRNFEDEKLTLSDCYKLDQQADEKIYLYDVNESLTIAFALFDKDTLTFLYINNKSEACDWVKDKRCDLNDNTNSVQLYSVVSCDGKRKNIPHLFDKYSDVQLLDISVPERQLNLVRTIEDYNHLVKTQYSFENTVYEILKQLAVNNDYEYALAKLESYKKGESSTYASALTSDLSRRSFVVVNGQTELSEIIDAPLEKWRIFLHPDQRMYAEKDFSGSVKLVGAAGTGKTVVAMHRAKSLVNKGNRVLLTTYNVVLTKDLESNLKKLIAPSNMKQLEVINVDALIKNYAKNNRMYCNLVYMKKDLLEVWNEAIKRTNTDLEYDAEFYYREWKEVYSVLDNMNLEEYYDAKRKGTGVRVSKGIRRKIKEVFDCYIDIMNRNGNRDIDFLTYECREKAREEKDFYYDSIIIDELQDMSLNQLKFLRLLVKEGPNDMFIVGDSRQRIYNSKISIEQTPINVKNRSFELTVNYRTTEETRNLAKCFLGGMDIDNMDEEYEEEKIVVSLTHGADPIVENFKSFEDQMSFIKKELKNLAKLNAKLQDICLVSRSRNELEKIEAYLQKENINAQIIDADDADDESSPKLKLATMHRVKGLEFRYVFVVSINESVMPVLSDNKDSVQDEYKYDIEKSLLYVAMTRAQKQAYLLSYGKPSKFIQNYIGKKITEEDIKETDKYIEKNIVNNDKYKIFKTHSINELINKYEDKSKWQYYLADLMEEKGKKSRDLYDPIGMPKQKYSRLINGETNVTKDDLIGFSFCLCLDIETAEILLNKAGFAFTLGSPRDLVIMAYMERGDYSVRRLNDELMSRGYRYLYNK